MSVKSRINGRLGVAAVLPALATICAPPAAAQTARAEAVSSAIVTIEDHCPITEPPPSSDPESNRFVGTLLATLFAGVAGDLATSGLNAIGNAIENASKEKAFVVEGASSFNFYKVDGDGVAPRTWAIVPDLAPYGDDGKQNARCLVLAYPGSTSSTALDAGALKSAFSAVPGIDGRATAAAALLKRRGLTSVPGLYVEAEILRATDGMVIRPVLVRYAEPLPKAPTGAKVAELDVSFATPGGADATDIGTIFALTRVKLPAIAPGKAGVGGSLLLRSQLVRYAGVVVPLRPTTGSPDVELARRNAVRSAYETKMIEVNQLRDALALAQRNESDNTVAADKVKLHNAVTDSAKALADAIRQFEKLKTQEAGLSASSAGSTNVKARLLVIRDENAFGMAIAKALKSQADASGKAVTAGLTPKDEPAWAQQDTALVNAQADVRAAQRALDEAIANGDTAKIPALQDGVIKAQAAANQAAAAANKPLPYVIIP